MSNGFLKEKYSKLYVLLLFLTCLGDSKIFKESYGMGFGTASKIFILFITAIAGFKILKETKRSELKRIVYLFEMMAVSLILVYAISSFIWIFNFSSLSVFIKGYKKIGFHVLGMFVVISAIYLFNENSIRYSLLGLELGNLFIMAQALLKFGFSASFNAVVQGIIHSDVSSKGFFKAMEINDLTFAICTLAFYILLYQKKKRIQDWIMLGIAIPLLIVGFKRVVFVAIAVALFTHLLLKSFKYKQYWIFGFIVSVLCYVYIWFSISGEYAIFMDAIGIETMGRSYLYRIISKYASFDITYFGLGFENASTIIYQLTHGELTAVHNSLLSGYVELGFIGCFIVLIWLLVIKPALLEKRPDFNIIAYYTILMFMLTIGLSDNNIYYFWSMLVLRLIPLATIKFKEEDNARLNFNNSSCV